MLRISGLRRRIFFTRDRLELCAGLACCLASPLSGAQAVLPSWDFEPGVRLGLFYEDNVRLSVRNPESSPGGIAEAYGLLSRSTEASDLSVRAGAISRYYVDVSELDTTDGSLEAAWAYRTERSEFGLGASFLYDSTLTSEEETTGLVQDRKRRKRFEIAPTWQYDVSERSRLGANFSFVDVSYEDVAQIVLTDYQFARLGLDGEYDLTERAALVGRLGFDRYDPEEQAFGRTESYGAEAGVSYELSERTTLTALGGVRSANTDSGIPGRGDDSSTGPIFEVGFERDYEPGSIRLVIGRSLLPSGRGELLDTTRAALTVSRPVTERLTASLRAVGVRNRNADEASSFNDRDYLSISPSLRWQLGQSTWLDLSYRYRNQDRDNVGSADANAVFLGFGHDWAAR